MSKILIIGGVAAGAGCAARLRRLDEKAQIIMLERGEYISYANCGLPYHVGDVIQSRDALLVTKPEVMRERFNVDVRTRNEALSIDRGSKSVRIKDHVTGEEYTESYDKLVIATGSSPLRPRILGIDSPRILTLWTVPDTDHIRSMIRDHGAKRAVVVGGGFIGLEMAENLHHAGLAVSIVEATDQVMAPVDPEMAMILHKNIRDNGVDLHLSDGVASFEDTTSGVSVKLSSGKILTADFVILSIGVRPNSQIAKEAGLEVNARGGIIVNDRLQTSDPDIYAAGDVIEVEDFISKERTMVPLAGPANKQGRIVADNIAGIPSTYKGTQGSSVAQIFDLTAASTGANEKTLIRRGLVRGKDYTSILISQGSHAGYYPGAVQMIIKLLFSMNGAKIFGAQIIGPDGVDKRIDTIGTAIRLGAGVVDLKDLELAYAPPFSSAKDPVKDQTDFLSQLSYNQISKLMFPIGHMMKSQVRDIAHAAHLPSADRKDSQGICFLGKVNYNDFLRRYLGEREGKIVELETGRVLGTHRGYWFHTIGQRKGLFLSGGPWFVVKKDIQENVLYVSQGYDPDSQYGNRINRSGFHYLSYPLWQQQIDNGQSVDVKFKIRHTPEFIQGHLSRTPDGYTILSDTRVQGIAAGQYATIYDNDAHLVVATGMIS